MPDASLLEIRRSKTVRRAAQATSTRLRAADVWLDKRLLWVEAQLIAQRIAQLVAQLMAQLMAQLIAQVGLDRSTTPPGCVSWPSTMLRRGSTATRATNFSA